VPIPLSILLYPVTWATNNRPPEPDWGAKVSQVQPVQCLLEFLRIYDVSNVACSIQSNCNSARTWQCLRKSPFHLDNCSRQSTPIWRRIHAGGILHRRNYML